MSDTIQYQIFSILEIIKNLIETRENPTVLHALKLKSAIAPLKIPKYYSIGLRENPHKLVVNISDVFLTDVWLL